MAKSIMEQLALLPEEERLAALEGLDPDSLVWDWSVWARPEQKAPEGDWNVWLVMAGRGFGKTRLASEWVREQAKYTKDGQLRFALAARTAADVRDVIVEGEALALETLVATPTGFTPIGELKSGDVVIGGDGLPCTVTEAFPVLYNRPCFKVNVEGAEIIADANHKWVTSSHRERGYESRKDMPKGVYESVLTTLDIFETLKTNKGYKVSNHAIRSAVILGSKQELPVAPYTLGLWLGDGTAKSATITSHNGDQPFVRSRIEHEGYETSDHATKFTFGILGLHTQLRSAGLLKNKHIPDVYFNAPITTRLSLLQGLIDSDGSVSKRGQVEFGNTNPDLVNGLVRLASSLGIKTRVTQRKSKRINNFGVTDSGFRVRFTTSMPVASLPRKAERIKNWRSEEKWRYVNSIVPTDSVPVRCIAVDSPDNTFLITEHYVRTHNSGIIAVSPPSEKPHYEPSKRRLTWPNGNTATLFTADEPDSLRGPQFTHAWGDEVAAWRQTPDAAGMTAFDNLRVGTRLGRNPQILCTTTPKRVPLLYKLIEESRTDNPNGAKVVITRGSTLDNAGNLSSAYLDTILGVYEGTTLARQELYGEMLDDIEGALWNEEMVEKARHVVYPPITPLRIIGVDPSVAENPRDECGIVVCAATAEPDLFKRNAWVLEDASVHGSPDTWARKVVEMARKWGCPVVAEVNQGGALVRNAINTIDPTIKVLEVHSKNGKALRAEPVVLAYEQERVHHVGYIQDLESQMYSWIPGEGKSPDRVDALVHALTALLIKPPPGFSGGKIRARSFADRKLGVTNPNTRPGGRIFRVR